MMRAYACFDDTDNLGAPRGTGKLARWFEEELPEGCRMWGVVRQQLLVDPAVPYTSHNSSACVVVDIPERAYAEELAARGIAHLEKLALPGSDPGICVAVEGDAALARLMEFGRLAATTVTSQAAAMHAADGIHLSGHGGTNDGIIGAAAGVGLTAWGWSGRFVEYGGLRDYAEEVSLEDLEAAGMLVLPINRNVVSPKAGDLVVTGGWLRPQLWGGRPCVPVSLVEPGVWRAFGKNGDKAVRKAG